ncbi:hypothetical protein Hypma_007026 [Hypsizygus marmoreus]|uniref:Uncharacterized protein n=1 Tax=Hypsizygus marmoreus TaxID=39966 RepID=A0A369KF50_HYPMA|nr:hypothetical protein Hypma_007026 [Hypsizygus marmoreus]
MGVGETGAASQNWKSISTAMCIRTRMSQEQTPEQCPLFLVDCHRWGLNGPSIQAPPYHDDDTQALSCLGSEKIRFSPASWATVSHPCIFFGRSSIQVSFRSNIFRIKADASLSLSTTIVQEDRS